MRAACAVSASAGNVAPDPAEPAWALNAGAGGRVVRDMPRNLQGPSARVVFQP